MNDRKQLHALVDSLPERALDSAEKYLQAIQTWPRKEPDRSHIARLRSDLEQKREKFLKGGAVGASVGTGGWVIDRNNKTFGSYSQSEHNWETGELTEKTFRLYHDYPLEITERFRMRDEDKLLEYDFHISGLGNEHGFVLQFKAAGG
jgi:hypothetical protein